MVPALLTVATLCGAQPPLGAPADSLVALYQTGRTWQEFFDAAKARKTMWKDNYDQGEPPPELVDRARAAGGQWRILAVAEDWCGDSANTVPYLARLVEMATNLELRIVNSKDGRWVMDRHKTDDGRAATPTIVLLDPDGNERGCLVERPAPLRTWVADNKPKLSEDDFQSGKMAWYKADRGRATILEMVELVERATQGPTTC